MKSIVFAKLLSSATFIFSLLACGGGNSDTPAALPTLASCYNLTIGNSLALTDTPNISNSVLADGTTVTHIAGAIQVSHLATTYPGATVNRRAVSTNAVTGVSTSSNTYIAFPANGSLYSRLANTSSTGATTSTTVFSGFSRDLTLTPGQSQTYTYTASAGVGTPTSITRKLTFVGVEDIVTPTGTYKNACKQTLTQIFPAYPGAVTETFWYANGFGNVKEVLVITFPDGRVPASLTRTIQ